MSKTQASRSQASKSSPEDALGKIPKSIQKAVPAHVGAFTSTSDINEALGGKTKKMAPPANGGFQNQPGQERDSLNERQLSRVSRPVPGDAKEVPNGAAKARRAGPHGKIVQTDGSSQ